MAKSSEIILKVTDLRKVYGDKVAVDGISFDVKKGEIFGILGPNGAGKTTTLEMIETLREIDGGSATIAGVDVAKHPYDIRGMIGVQPQTPGFQDKTKLTELIQMFAAAYGEKVNPKKFLDDVNLGEKADSYIEQLSGGQKQRFSIVAALVHNPKVFFLDEPTTGLDPQARRNLWKLIEDVRDRGISVILTTHYMDEAEVLCDRIAIMDHGKIIQLDTPKNLIKALLQRGFSKEQKVEQANLEDVFIDLTGEGVTDMTLGQKLYTVWAFFTVNLKRLFRDKTALFFTFLFPLIFLFVFGSLNSGDSSVSFNIAIINESKAPFTTQFIQQIGKQKAFKIDKTIHTFAAANEKMSRGELDATIELPPSFGVIQPGKAYPSGQAVVHYTQNNQSAAQTLTTVMQAELQGINTKLVKNDTPFTITSRQNNERSLSSFDYTFTGLLGFAVLGSGIFGPINIFPELKKMGILRRLHTTPLRVWQYFLSVMLGNAVVGLMSLAVMFAVAVAVFHLKIVGNYFELAAFLVLGIITILGIGLAIGGWAKNERQAAPLANIIVFPMMFLSGTFFPRFLMPEWLQHITFFMPLTPVIDGARMIATEGKGLLDLGPQIGILAAWLVIVYLIAFRVFRWE